MGGASFSEWATLISHEAHSCFVAGADIATIILCASSVEAYLRSEMSDQRSKLVDLIDGFGFKEDVREQVHQLRKERNNWVHLAEHKSKFDLTSFEKAYTPELEKAAMLAYHTMLRVLFSDQWV